MVELTIPNEWIKVNISDIADVDLGKTPRKSDYLSAGDFKVVKFRDVDYSGIDWSKNKDGFVGKNSVHGLRELKLHDVLITASAHSSGHIGKKICFVTKLPKDYKKIYFCGELLGISAKNGFLSPKFCFYYFLSHTGYKEIQAHVKGVHLTSGQARNMSIPFTLQLEQDRIIEIVEELLSDLDNAIENIKKAEEQLKIYRLGILKRGFVGQLTENWRQKYKVESNDSLNFPDRVSEILNELPELPDGWIYTYFSKAGELKRGKSKHRPRNDPKLFGGRYPFIQTGEIRAAKGILRTYTETYSDAGLAQSKLWPVGTLCITIAANIAETAFLGIEACFPDSVVGFIAHESLVNPKFIEYFIQSTKQKIQAYAPATAQKNINLTILENLIIPFCRREEQDQIVQEIDARFSVCDQLESTIKENLQKAEALRQSILKQAFEGRLTEQWRKKHKNLISGENSAEALIKKIKAEKDILEVKSKGKKKHD